MASYLYLLSFITICYSLTCPHSGLDCLLVTDDPRFVECLNHVCTCVPNRGFSGTATLLNRCSCPYPKALIEYEGSWYCVNPVEAVEYQLEQESNAIYLGIITTLYHSLIWPTPAEIMDQLIVCQSEGVACTGGLWDAVAPGAIGRVDPLGEFADQDGIVEYFFGQVWTGASTVSQIYINKLLVDGNQVDVSVDMTFNTWNVETTPKTLLFQYNLTQSGVFTFNNQNQIQEMDLIIHNLGWAVNGFFANQTAEFEQVCAIILYEANCTAAEDPLGYYSSFEDCFAFMASIDYGTWDELRENSVACRQFHSVLAIARPEVHCVHAGRTGGTKCIPTEYSSYYDQQY